MADKEEIIFSLKVEGSDALTEMERFKKSILQTKQEQQELTKAYKAGNVTLDEFVQDSVRLEAILKKQQSSYNNVQKSVTGVKTQLDKLIDSNKKISADLQKTSKSFQDAASNINVAGVNIGQLTTRLASFANPATAAVGIVTALGAAYARSTIGAKDLEFAQNQLSFATTILTNELAGLVSSAEDGEGAITKLGNKAVDIFASKYNIGTLVPRGILSLLGIDIKEIQERSKELAMFAEEMQDLQREEVNQRGEANERLTENAELLTEIQSEQTSYNNKLLKTNQIIENIRKNQILLTNAKAQELAIAQQQLAADPENDNLKDAVAQLLKDLSAIERESDKRIQAAVRLQQNLNEAEAKRLKLIEDNKVTGGRKLQFIPGKGTQADAMQAEQDTANAILAIQVNTADKEIETHAMTEEEKTAATAMGVKNRIALAQAESDAKVLAATMVLDSVARLASEGTEIQKAASLLSIAVSTTEAVTKGIAASQSVPFPGNLVAMATTIATVLGAIANAKSSLGFAEGGWTGPGSKYQPAGIVHADEYVTPKHIVHSAAAQPHLAALESMRLRGYADGGLVTNAMTAETNQSLVIANSMKHMPSPEVSVVEVTRVQNKVRMKESAAKGKPFIR